MTYDPNLPADHQGMFDPGNDEDEMLDEDGNPIEDDEDLSDNNE